MRKLVLIGGGGHCKSVLDTAARMNCFDEIVITDPNIEQGKLILDHSIVGSDNCLEELFQKGFKYAFITIGSVNFNPLREKIADKIASLGFLFPVIHDPSAIISDSAIIGDGSFIGKNAIINAEAKIGKHCIINTSAIIEHECNVGDFSHISVGTVLCGEVTIGGNCVIGSNSTVIQRLIVGNNSVIGAGSVVTKDIPSNCTAIGVPARIL